MIQESSSRGYLIAVEGCDRCGKSTQCFKMQAWLQEKLGHPVEYWKFPDRTTPIGQLINGYLTGNFELSDETIHLLFSANRWELKEKMEKTLAAGTTIILDRYVYSGVSYSSAKGLDLDWCKAPDHGLPQPDLILFVDLATEKAMARGGYGEERYEKAEMQAKVRARFGELMKKDRDGKWVLVDGDQEPEALFESCKSIFERELLQDSAPGPIHTINWI